MSWSEDTRCLYCEGRLPLYRKITHGQFCSSAHRKAYWQEQELLAIERLQQSHSSLRSYRPLEVRQDVPLEAPSGSDLGSLTQFRVAARPELEASLELAQVPSFDVNLGPLPDVGESRIAALEFLSLLAPDFYGLAGGSPELVAADPIEYEITVQALQPSHVASGPGTNPLPEGPRVAWSYLEPQALLVPQASGVNNAAGAAGLDCDVEFCHPRLVQPAVGMRSAGLVRMPHSVALEAQRAAATNASNLQVLELKATPVTSVALEVPVQSDVLLQLLDQQMPHPDRLHVLAGFAARRPAVALACLSLQQFAFRGEVINMVMPAAAAPAVTAEYEPIAGTEMLQLSAVLLAAQGTRVSKAAIQEIEIHPQGVTSAILPVAESIHQMGMAGLQSL
ncbi:MAG TPA: hypothetical protein VFD98_03765, partial [Terracidiphilus sp.]|nr:hypothetical protein [Terracidiphilus sp.]